MLLRLLQSKLAAHSISRVNRLILSTYGVALIMGKHQAEIHWSNSQFICSQLLSILLDVRECSAALGSHIRNGDMTHTRLHV